MKVEKIPPTPPEPEYRITLTQAELEGLRRALSELENWPDVFVRERVRLLLNGLRAA